MSNERARRRTGRPPTPGPASGRPNTLVIVVGSLIAFLLMGLVGSLFGSPSPSPTSPVPSIVASMAG